MIPYEEIQKLSPSALIDLYVFDATSIGGEIFYFHAGTNKLSGDIVWNGITYTRFPIEAGGFSRSGKGASAQPKVRVSNAGGLMGALCDAHQDLIGTKLTRIRTFAKYLDSVNFPGGVNPMANPNKEMMREVWFVKRKAHHDDVMIEFELRASYDVTGKKVPGRQVVATCRWRYRGAYCTYDGPPVANIRDEPTSSIDEDDCGKKVHSCELRFGTGKLPHGGFPGSGILR